MLVELAAANAAFSVIKQALANGKELSSLGSKVFDYFDNKAKIQEKATKKGGGSDMEEFMALEQLKAQAPHYAKLLPELPMLLTSFLRNDGTRSSRAVEELLVEQEGNR